MSRGYANAESCRLMSPYAVPIKRMSCRRHQRRRCRRRRRWIVSSGHGIYRIIINIEYLILIFWTWQHWMLLTSYFELDYSISSFLLEFVSEDAPPQLLRTFNEQTLVPGPFVTFKCAALANPAPDFTWLLDNYPLATSDRLLANSQIFSNFFLVNSTADFRGNLKFWGKLATLFFQ